MPIAERLHTVVDATRSALADPRDTKQAFRIADALSFGTFRRMTRRYRATPIGAQRLRDRTRLLGALTDRAALEALPPDSLGRAYIAFLDSEGITADGLVQASLEGRRTLSDPDDEFVAQQIRDMHDLWHTVLGYKGDLLGEAAILAFSFAQLRHPGVGFLAGLGAVMSPEPRFRRFIVAGFRRGRRAAWFPGQDWESLLAQPLADVRRQLGVEDVPVYEPVRPEDRLLFAERLKETA